MNGRIQVCRDLAGLSEEGARRFVEAAREAIAARGRFLVALTGGSTPKPMYELLATPHWSRQVDWSCTQLFWGDERFVLPNDPRSNYRMTRETLLSHVPAPPENVHPIPTALPTAERAAAEYEKTLRAGSGGDMPRFDLMLLGMGENGHTASLFPDSPALDERSRLVLGIFVPEVAMDRVTMTVPVLNASRRVLFLVSGAQKAGVLREVIAGGYQPRRLPAQLVRPESGDLLWLLDQAAATQIPPELRADAT